MTDICISETRPVGEIAASLAGASAVFRKNKIDFCCNGGLPLGEAARLRGVDPSALVTELAALAPTPADAPQESSELVDFILARYHETHRRDLAELVRLARRVESVHRDHPQAPAGLANVLEAARSELEDHMAKEENILFPAIRFGFKGSLFGPISVMRHEHDDHVGLIREIQGRAHGFAPPDGACNSWRALYAGAERFVDDLAAHIRLENEVLFPRFV